MAPYDPLSVALHFPFFAKHPGITYLDNAATAQVLGSAAAAAAEFYGKHVCVHRGSYGDGTPIEEIYEGARSAVAKYIGAAEPEEIVFVRGTTEAINLAAHCWSRAFLRHGDRIVTTAMEHHSNFLPWRRAADDFGAEFCVCPITPSGELDMEAFEKLLGENTRLVAVCHASNVLGTINPVAKIAEMAHAVGAVVLVDGAKWAGSGAINVGEIGSDFYALSGHKMFAGTGIGILHCRRKILESMDPMLLGGGMADLASNHFACRPLPMKFEAGTQNIAGAIALREAVAFLSDFPWASHREYCERIGNYVENSIGEMDGIRLLGSPPEKVSVFSVVSDDVHSHDLATMLATKDVCVRAGHHCATPLFSALAVGSALRASFGIYNTLDDAKKFIGALRWAMKRLS
ncbi:MAG: cysteine desulfurase [Puniceicoccales bacterium]|nr:cysteine desulfurase [Puniceicoccales bacterium]